MYATREEKRCKTKNAILAAAVELFRKNGFKQTSIAQLAKITGVGKGTVYNYFKTKEDILQACCDNNLEFIHEQMARKTNKDAPVLDQLILVFMAEFGCVTQNPEFSKLYMQQILFPREDIIDKNKDRGNKYFEIIFPILKRAQARGEIRRELELLHLCGHFFAVFLLLLHLWYSKVMIIAEAEDTLRTLFTQALVGLEPSPKI